MRWWRAGPAAVGIGSEGGCGGCFAVDRVEDRRDIAGTGREIPDADCIGFGNVNDSDKVTESCGLRSIDALVVERFEFAPWVVPGAAKDECVAPGGIVK